MLSNLLLMSALTFAVADAAATYEADLKRMQGDWMVASMIVSGMTMSDEEAQSLFRTVEGDRYVVSRYSKPVGKGTFKLDATKNPKWIDSTPAAGPGAGKPILGIYEFNGQQLRICNAGPGKPRPTGFESKPTSERTMIVWEPEKK